MATSPVPAEVYVFDGANWVSISPSVSGSGTGGTGADGKSVEVFGPQDTVPTPTRKGDIWLDTTVYPSASVATLVHAPSPVVHSISHP
jgi:hypothetical protein